jgi:hypothetical protein
MTGPGYYTLIRQTPVPCGDALAWAREFEHMDRRVGLHRAIGARGVGRSLARVALALGRFAGRRARPDGGGAAGDAGAEEVSGMTTHAEQCPFYGYHAVVAARMLLPQYGNQCALITSSYAPCRLEARGLLPILEDCELRIHGNAEVFAEFQRVERRGGEEG